LLDTNPGLEYTCTRIIIINGGVVKAKVTLTLDAALWEKFRIQAIREKTSGSAIIDRLMLEYLGAKAQRGQRARATTQKRKPGRMT
jgi:hypothetical protein